MGGSPSPRWPNRRRAIALDFSGGRGRVWKNQGKQECPRGRPSGWKRLERHRGVPSVVGGVDVREGRTFPFLRRNDVKKVCRVLCVTAAGAAATAQAAVVATARSPEGLFSEFRVELDVERAPLAVANFMGLVGGSQGWVDPESGWGRGGKGDAFYDGMVFDWHMGSLLRGGLREETRGDITEHTGGPGYTLRSETGESGRSEAGEGTLAPVGRIPVDDGALTRILASWFGDVSEVDARHSGGAELGLFLTNGVVPWTVFGHVLEEDKAGLRALADAVGKGATEVRWEVDTSRTTAAERAALDAARAELPRVHGTETRLYERGPTWNVPGQSRWWVSASTNLTAGWHLLDMWNEEAGPMTFSVPWENLGWREPDGSDVALNGRQGFASFPVAEHPAMAGAPLGGKWTIEVVDGAGERMKYRLDFDPPSGESGGTGTWEKLEGTNVTASGQVRDVFSARETANSICVMFFLGNTIRFYWFGVEEDAVSAGLFQATQLVVDLGGGVTIQTISGTYKWEQGWGKAAKAVARRLAKKKGNGTRGTVVEVLVCSPRPEAPSERRPRRTGKLVLGENP